MRMLITRQGNRLVIDDAWQNFTFGQSASLSGLPTVDFSQPIDKPMTWLKGGSEPRE